MIYKIQLPPHIWVRIDTLKLTEYVIDGVRQKVYRGVHTPKTINQALNSYLRMQNQVLQNQKEKQ